MRRNSLQLSIPNPCAQSWAEMADAPGGKFCAHCQHTVTDYAFMSDAALLRHVKAHGLGCGRFHKDQLDRVVLAPRKRPAGRFMLWLLALGLLFKKANAQDATVHKTIEAVQVADSSKTKDNSPKNYIRIRGTIKDQKGGPLINAVVKVEGSGIGTVSDYDGNYELTLPDTVGSLSLLFYFQGQQAHYSVELRNSSQINLDATIPISQMFITGAIMITTREYPRLLSPKGGEGIIIRSEQIEKLPYQ